MTSLTAALGPLARRDGQLDRLAGAEAAGDRGRRRHARHPVPDPLPDAGALQLLPRPRSARGGRAASSSKGRTTPTSSWPTCRNRGTGGATTSDAEGFRARSRRLARNVGVDARRLASSPPLCHPVAVPPHTTPEPGHARANHASPVLDVDRACRRRGDGAGAAPPRNPAFDLGRGHRFKAGGRGRPLPPA